MNILLQSPINILFSLTIIFALVSLVYLPSQPVYAVTYTNTYDDDGNLTSSRRTTGSTYVGRDDDGNSVYMDYGCTGDCDPMDPNISFRVNDMGYDDDDGGYVPAVPPPTVSLQAKIKPHNTWYPDHGGLFEGGGDPDNRTLYVKPNDELRLRWSSTNASSCSFNFDDAEPYLEAEASEEDDDWVNPFIDGESFQAYLEEYEENLEEDEEFSADSVIEGFGGWMTGDTPNNETDGTYDVVPDLDPSYSIDYRVTCSGTGGEASSSLTITVPGFVPIDFVPAARIIRSGDTVDISWKLELTDSLTVTDDDDLVPYSYPCFIIGATPNTEPYTFNASDNNGSGQFTTRPLSNKFVNKLYCGDREYGETEVEVIPTVIEL